MLNYGKLFPVTQFLSSEVIFQVATRGFVRNSGQPTSIGTNKDCKKDEPLLALRVECFPTRILSLTIHADHYKKSWIPDEKSDAWGILWQYVFLWGGPQQNPRKGPSKSPNLGHPCAWDDWRLEAYWIMGDFEVDVSERACRSQIGGSTPMDLALLLWIHG